MPKHIIDADISTAGGYTSANAQKIAKLDDNGRVGDSARLSGYIITTAGGTEANRIAFTNTSGQVGDSVKVGGLNLTSLDSRYTPASHAGTGGTTHPVVTSSTAGFMSGALFDKLNTIYTDADKVTQGTTVGDGTIKVNDVLMTVYTHPSSHSADIITDGTTNKAYTATEKTKLSGVATGAEVNQNAFAKMTFGGTTATAGIEQDTFEIIAGTNISGTINTSTKQLTLNAVGNTTLSGFKVSTGITALPTASSTHRGKIIVIEGGVGVADVTYICLKSSTDTYSWKQIIVG